VLALQQKGVPIVDVRIAKEYREAHSRRDFDSYAERAERRSLIRRWLSGPVRSY
jgi:hypothetical protein